jgi:hypothetical protein
MSNGSPNAAILEEITQLLADLQNRETIIAMCEIEIGRGLIEIRRRIGEEEMLRGARARRISDQEVWKAIAAAQAAEKPH